MFDVSKGYGLICDAMQMGLQRREFMLDNNMYGNMETSLLREGLIKIDLGRQVGHTTAAVRFMEDHKGRGIYIAGNWRMVDDVKKGHRVSEPDYYISAGARCIDSMGRLPREFKGRDIIIVDTSSFIDDVRDKVINLITDMRFQLGTEVRCVIMLQ